ncbi:MAG: hypothetical protein M3285_09575, partial [Actinomycetota bacterium]|nr:hypothetical protein [Actinomycetota bacterium]
LVADSSIWLFVHFMIAWAIALGFVGLVAIARSFTGEAGESWGRLALASAIGSVAIAIIGVTVDGVALKEVADNWAEAGRGTESSVFAAADAVANVALALFITVIGSLFGFTAILFGIAGLVSNNYPKWLGYAALVAGLVGLLAGSIAFLSGPSDLAFNILFAISSFLYTIWLFASGWFLWQRAGTLQPEEETVAVAA